MRLMLAALIAAAAFAAPSAARDRAPIPVATPTGKPLSCISVSQIRDTHVRDDRTIDFMTDNRQGYRNTLPYACPSLASEQRFGYATSTGELCSVDTITVLYSGPGPIRGPSCGLGQFQPITLPSMKRAK